MGPTVGPYSKREVAKLRKAASKWTGYLYAMQSGICSLCDTFMAWEDRSVDHITPLHDGGNSKPKNLQCTHIKCNQQRNADIMRERIQHEQNGLQRDATLSENERYRYTLSRLWDDSLPIVVFVMLNPSTADARTDDPTIRRCIHFAKSWGWGGFMVVNLFAYRATKPAVLKRAENPIGVENDNHICRTLVLENVGDVVCAWGANGGHMRRDAEVLELIHECGFQPKAMGLTQKNRHPRHPLYLKNDTIADIIL